MNPTDHHLETLFRHSTSDLQPEVTDLVAGGIGRGRRRRRRQTVGAALATVAVVGVIGVAASVAPGLVSEPESTTGFAATGDPAKPDAPAEPSKAPALDAGLAIGARDIPAEIASMLPDGDLGPLLTEGDFPLVNTAHTRIVHFRWDGTLTSFIIEPASKLGTCEELAAPEGCAVVDGLKVLTWGPTLGDGVTAQGVMVWQHGYTVSALSYNAPDGKDVPPVLDAPPISLEQLTEISSSEVWFSAS